MGLKQIYACRRHNIGDDVQDAIEIVQSDYAMGLLFFFLRDLRAVRVMDIPWCHRSSNAWQDRNVGPRRSHLQINVSSHF